MRERLKEIFSQLPPEGIAVHGTNMSRAKAIQEEGFVQQNLHPGLPLNKTWYIVQPPNANPYYANEHLSELRKYLREAHKYAVRAATWHQFKYSGTNEDKTPSIVVFKPLKVINMTTHDNQLFPFPRIQSEDLWIPPNHILGVFHVSNILNEKRLLGEIFNLIMQKSIINLSKPQSPQTAQA